MVDLITSPWPSAFETWIQTSQELMIICSPFVGELPCRRITELLDSSQRSNLKMCLLTNLSSENMLSRATDVRGLICLLEAIPNCDVRFLPNLHAKIYVSERQAIVTSANLTRGSISRNLEYGVSVSDATTVERIRCDAQSFHSIGTTVDLAQLRIFDRVVNELSDLQRKCDQAGKSALRFEFEQKLKQADEQILRLRAASMSAHAGFAQTIVHVLTMKGPCDTKRMYREIQEIHPDLCDDSIKLVIHGEEWSQPKWKHRVRHAQQFLSRQGRIERTDGAWHLVR